MARDVVERAVYDECLRSNSLLLKRNEEMLAVVEAAENLGTCPFCGRRNRLARDKSHHAETCVLARLYAGSSGDA